MFFFLPKRIVATSICVLFFYSGQSQKIYINGEETNRLLKWKDFTGKPAYIDRFAARIMWRINHKMVRDSTSSPFRYKSPQWEVHLYFDGNHSWVKGRQKTLDLLEHEQGHFNNGILCLQEITDSIRVPDYFISNTFFQFRQLVNKIEAKYRELDEEYDDETNHGLNRREQTRWNWHFRKYVKLVKLPR